MSRILEGMDAAEQSQSLSPGINAHAQVQREIKDP